MLRKDQRAFVMQHIKRNKMRVFMTVLATMIGCAFLIVLASVGFGMQKTVENEILQDEAVTRIHLYEGVLTAEQIKEIEKRDNVKAVLVKTLLPFSWLATFEDRKAHVEANLYDMTTYAVTSEKLFRGRYATKDNEIVVGYHFAQTLVNEAEEEKIATKAAEAEKNGEYYDGRDEGYDGEIIGKEIMLKAENEEGQAIERLFKVVGILSAPSYDWQIDNSIIMPANNEAAFAPLHKNPLVKESTIYVDTMMNVKPLLKELKADGYAVFSAIEQLDEVNVFFLVFKAGLIFVGTIAVLIASIGIFNTMTMAVTERTREIGVLKAIGASPRLIQRLFIMESAFIGILGTVLAVILSYVVSVGVNALLPLILQATMPESSIVDSNIIFSYIPWELVAIASCISISVAMISGWRPARKATKIDVIQALRQEL